MKERKGFVTNSSSSSFIIAKHKDFTEHDLKDALYNMKDDIKEFLNRNARYLHFE